MPDGSESENRVAGRGRAATTTIADGDEAIGPLTVDGAAGIDELDGAGQRINALELLGHQSGQFARLGVNQVMECKKLQDVEGDRKFRAPT